MEIDIINWIKQQQTSLEEIIVAAAREFKSSIESSNFEESIYDIQQTSHELWNLNSGKDLCYDRPSIGFTYSLWYHPKRVNTFLHFFLKLLINHSKDDRIDLYDLGAGTGAVQWAVGIVYAALKRYSKNTPKVRIVNIDTSPFMLHYNEKFLWKNFIIKYPVCKDIKVEYSINSWVNAESTFSSNVWLTASYLFDHSENSDELTIEFRKLIDRFKPGKILLLSAMPKSSSVNTAADSILSLKLGYENLSSNYPVPVFSGYASHINSFRKDIQSLYNHGFSGEVKWNIDSLYGRVVILPQIELPIFMEELPIYTTAQKNRLKVRLSDEQLEASLHTGKPTIIDGPAGSGKSIVLSERVKNVIEANDYNPQIKILITSFNKGVILLLGNWLEELLLPGSFERQFQSWKGEKQEHSFFHFDENKNSNVTLYNLDKLPSRIGNIRSKPIGFEQELAYMAKATEIIIQEEKINAKKYFSILNPRFLIEEYHRIIFGQICTSERKYQSIERPGRGTYPMLKTNTLRRKFIWKIIKRYLNLLKNDGCDSFISWRHKFLQSILKNGVKEKFDYIFIDEIQDCTRGDFTIFESLVEDTKNLVVAGDLAQSINLGASAYIPSGFERKKLKQSYRLPLRVSQAVRPLSEKIRSKHSKRKSIGNPDIIVPYKGSPPGSRPILIYSKDLYNMAIKISSAFKKYDLYQIESISIFEEDEELSDLLKQKELLSVCEKIKKAKGLERHCVLWSTRVNINSTIDIEESIYTIFTRTSSILIIAIFDDIKESFKDILYLLNKDWLINWDRETESFMTNLRREYKEALEEDDSDDDTELPSNEIDDTEI